MLSSSRQIIDGMLIDDFRLDFERRVLVFLTSVEQNEVGTETPWVEWLVIPAKTTLWSCCYVFELLLDFYRPETLYVDVLLLEFSYLFYWWLNNRYYFIFYLGMLWLIFLLNFDFFLT